MMLAPYNNQSTLNASSDRLGREKQDIVGPSENEKNVFLQDIGCTGQKTCCIKSG